MMFEKVGFQAMLTMALMCVLGIVIPLVLSIIWAKKTKQSYKKMIVGALMFFVFACVLENIPKALLLSPTTSIGQKILNSPILSVIIGGLLAGLFEETGRLVGFKVFLKKDLDDKKTAISYGIGHGGFEIAYIFVIGGIQYIIYSFMINSGTFNEVVNELMTQMPSQAQTLITLAQSLHSLTILSLIPSLIERSSAMLIHIACSIIVFASLKDRKWLWIVAILLHASFDFIAGAYQVGWITNVFVVEAILFVTGVVFFAVSYRLYKSLK